MRFPGPCSMSSEQMSPCLCSRYLGVNLINIVLIISVGLTHCLCYLHRDSVSIKGNLTRRVALCQPTALITLLFPRLREGDTPSRSLGMRLQGLCEGDTPSRSLGMRLQGLCEGDTPSRNLGMRLPGCVKETLLHAAWGRGYTV